MDEPRSKTKNSVTFSENDELNSESTSELDSLNMTIGDTSKSDSTLSLEENHKITKAKYAKMEKRCKSLEQQHEKLMAELNLEHKKNGKLENKIKFVKDNQEVFIRLKEAYVNMKYNEAAGRKMVEIREKSIQTWDGILCKACLDTEQTRIEMEKIKKQYAESFLISCDQIEQMDTTIKYMKDLVVRREQAWSVNLEREIALQSKVNALTDENKKLKGFISSPNMEHWNSEIETHALKKIIVKYEKRIQDMVDRKLIHKFASPLNETEEKIVESLMTKYSGSLKLKNKSKTKKGIKSRTVSLDRKSLPRYSSGESVFVKAKKSEAKSLSCNENAILMMDSIFGSESNILF